MRVWLMQTYPDTRMHQNKRYFHQYRDYEKRHLRWKHDRQDGIKYTEPTPPKYEGVGQPFHFTKMSNELTYEPDTNEINRMSESDFKEYVIPRIARNDMWTHEVIRQSDGRVVKIICTLKQ